MDDMEKKWGKCVYVLKLKVFSKMVQFLSSNQNNFTSRSQNNDFIQTQGLSTSSQWYGVHYITGF